MHIIFILQYAPLVEIANASIQSEGLNLHYVAANIAKALKALKFPNLHTVSRVCLYVIMSLYVFMCFIGNVCM